MKKTTALLIDDERLPRVALRKKLEKFVEIEVVGEASGIDTGINAIKELNPDLLFLDIQLTDGSGFDLLEKIAYNGKVIFVTAYDKYAIRAFEINAIDYLLKPVSQNRLKEAIKRLNDSEEKLKHDKPVKLEYDDRIMIMVRNMMHFIKLDGIICINASRDYTYLFTSDGKKFLSLKSMHNWEQSLPEKDFARIHRSWIINFNFVSITQKSGSSGTVQIIGMTEPLEISRRYLQILKSKYLF